MDPTPKQAKRQRYLAKRAERRMSDWQPISTYPNDGTPVLGFSPRLRDAGFSDGFMVVRRDGPKPLGSDTWVTHWMALPSPPSPHLNCEIAPNGAHLARRDAEGRIVDEHGRVMCAEYEEE